MYKKSRNITVKITILCTLKRSKQDKIFNNFIQLHCITSFVYQIYN